MSYFTTPDNCRLYYETHGFESQRPAIVFLNGTTQTTVHWRPQVLRFRGEFRILLYDGRAQGRSELGSAALSLERHGADLSALMDHLGLQRANLIGLSHGAHVALELAARHPQRVEGIVLCGLGDAPTARAEAMIRSWLEVVKSGGVQCLAWTVLPMILGEGFIAGKKRILAKMAAAIAVRNRTESLAAQLEAMLAYPPPREPAATLRLPVLVISGSQDLLVPSSSARKLADLCRAEYLKFEDCGHTVPAEAGERFNRELSRFLASIAGRNEP
jgi:3-oxoadipate enol-lactonase